MRHIRMLAIAALSLASVAHAELQQPPGVRATTPSYVVRQGSQQMAVFASHAECEADAQRRTASAGAARRAFQIRSGSGTVLSTASSLDECKSATIDRLTADGARRPVPPKTKESNVNSCVQLTSFSASFQPPTCVATHNYIATYVTSTVEPTPTCTVQPSTETRTCPAGTSGTWSQTSTVGPYPGCVVTWTPSSPPADRCPPVQQPTGPVLSLSIVNQLEVHLAWSGQTSRAYSLEKCRGSGCTNFAHVACPQLTQFIDVLPAGATARYRVRGASEINCTGTFTPYSSIQQVTVGGVVAPGEAYLSWTPGAVNESGPIAGYYIVYGGTPNLDRQIIVDNPSTTRYTVTGLAAGTWYFAVKQYTANFAQVSDLSVIRTKTVR